MSERKRQVLMRFFVTEPERDLILEKMNLLQTTNLSAYMRKMAIDGYIINTDYTDIKKQTAEIQKIGVNVNQIARRINMTGAIFAEDLQEIKEALAEIWRLQRLSLSKSR